jgi:hypothetical protein
MRLTTDLPRYRLITSCPSLPDSQMLASRYWFSYRLNARAGREPAGRFHLI